MRLKVKINKLRSALADGLTASERGILLVAFAFRQESPLVCWAMFMEKINYREYKKEMVRLQDMDFIEWSGYKSAKSSLEKVTLDPRVEEVVSYMNNMFGTRFKASSTTTYSSVSSRLKEYSIDELKLVISNRHEEWKDDAKMKKHLNPGTVFRASKFEKYLNEANLTKKGLGALESIKVGLKEGSLITYDLSKSLVDKEVYKVKFETDGVLSTSLEKRTGKEIKGLLKRRKNMVDMGMDDTYENIIFIGF
jgi:uncharacterized phage protein (TIGR02220 family)